MQITVELSYYPLCDQYKEPIKDFLNRISKNPDVDIATGIMSSVLAGEYDAVMNVLNREMKPLLEKHPSVFTLKVSNACKP